MYLFSKGIAAIPGTAGGFFLGGFICNRMKLKVAGILKFAIITCSVSLLFTTLVWVSCDGDEMAGINHPYKDRYVFKACSTLKKFDAIGIKHVLLCINNCQVPKEMLKPRANQGTR